MLLKEDVFDSLYEFREAIEREANEFDQNFFDYVKMKANKVGAPQNDIGACIWMDVFRKDEPPSPNEEILVGTYLTYDSVRSNCAAASLLLYADAQQLNSASRPVALKEAHSLLRRTKLNLETSSLLQQRSKGLTGFFDASYYEREVKFLQKYAYYIAEFGYNAYTMLRAELGQNQALLSKNMSVFLNWSILAAQTHVESVQLALEEIQQYH